MGMYAGGIIDQRTPSVLLCMGFGSKDFVFKGETRRAKSLL